MSSLVEIPDKVQKHVYEIVDGLTIKAPRFALLVSWIQPWSAHTNKKGPEMTSGSFKTDTTGHVTHRRTGVGVYRRDWQVLRPNSSTYGHSMLKFPKQLRESSTQNCNCQNLRSMSATGGLLAHTDTQAAVGKKQPCVHSLRGFE